MAVHRRHLAAALLFGLFAVGCTQESPDDEAAPVPSPVGTTDATGTPGTPTAPGATAPAGPMPEFCDELIPFTRVVQIVAAALEGGVERTYATDFSAASGRTARLTCGYGIRTAPPGQETPPPQVEISVSSYVDAAAAIARVEDTVGSARSAGQQVRAQAGTGHQGFVLADAAAVTYVTAVADRTVVVSLVRGLVPAAAESVVLLGLADAALGVPPPGS